MEAEPCGLPVLLLFVFEPNDSRFRVPLRPLDLLRLAAGNILPPRRENLRAAMSTIWETRIT